MRTKKRNNYYIITGNNRKRKFKEIPYKLERLKVKEKEFELEINETLARNK